MKQRLLLLAPLTLLLQSLLGCVVIPPYKTEHRYRIFYSRQAEPAVTAGAPADEIRGAFEPKTSVDLTLKEMASEGFSLMKIEPVPYGKGACVFSFERRVATGSARPVGPPLNLTGVYQSVDAADPVFYVLFPEPQAFTIHTIANNGMRTVSANWDGDQLNWDEEGAPHHALLSSDPRYLKIIRNDHQAGPSQSIARRVEVSPVSAPEELWQRRFLWRLRPKTLGLYQGW